MIYFDNAATSFPKPDTTAEAVDRAVRQVGGNPGRSGHALSLTAAEEVYNVRERAADFFQTQPEQVVFTANCTHALNIAIQGLVRPGGRVLTTNLEHNSVTRPLAALVQKGKISWTQIDVLEKTDRQILQAFAARLNGRCCLVVCTHASNVTGQLLPVRRLHTLCRQAGVPLVVDAAQTAGVFPLAVGKDADLICAAGHKGLYGPTSCGLLLLGGRLPRPLMQGGTGSESIRPQMPDFPPDRYEAGTVNTAGVLGLGAGLEFVQSRPDIRAHETALCRRAYRQLGMLRGVRLLQPDWVCRAPIVLFNLDGLRSSDCVQKLSDRGFAVRGGLHCAPAAHHALGTLPDGAVRFSPGAFNTIRETDDFCEAVAGLSS